MKKKTLSFALALLLLLSAVSCSETGSPDRETTPSADTTNTDITPAEDPAEEETEELTEEERRKAIADDLPEVTFDGTSFRVLTHDGYGGDYSYEITSEEQTGDTLNDSVYDRNMVVEDRFDVTIEVTTIDGPFNELKNMATAGIASADVVGSITYKNYVPINAKSALNWTTVPHVNLDKPWHNKLANDNATIADKLYGICSDLSISSMTYTYAIFFNMQMLEDHGRTSQDMYALVREGKWTIDTLIELSNEFYEDVDGGRKRDKNDTYGFGYFPDNPADVWLTAFDQPICRFTEDNELEVTWLTDKTVAALEKLVDWQKNGAGFWRYTGSNYEEETYFVNQKLALAPLRFYAAYHALREMEAPYSILPYPKWDEAQSAYYTNADDKYSSFLLPLPSYGNLDFIGTIFEALCAESYKSVYPTYYDEALKGRYSEEPETAEMVDLIMAGRNFDVSFQFGESYFQRLPYLFRDMLKDNDTNAASAYRKIQKLMEKNVANKLLPLYAED